MKNFPDLGVVLILTLAFWVVFALIEEPLQTRLHFPFPGLASAFIASLILESMFREKQK